MKQTASEEQVAISTQLFNFLQRVLHMTPAAFWWLIATLLFALTNLALKDEVWPHTPQVEGFFIGVILLAVVPSTWVVSTLAWRVAGTISYELWNTLWRLATVLGFIGSTAVTALLLICLMFWSIDKAS